jgi:hypothetical protein
VGPLLRVEQQRSHATRDAPRAVSGAQPGSADRCRHGRDLRPRPECEGVPHHRSPDLRAADRVWRVHLGVQPDAVHRRPLQRGLRAQHVRRRARPQPGAPRRARAGGLDAASEAGKRGPRVPGVRPTRGSVRSPSTSGRTARCT